MKVLMIGAGRGVKGGVSTVVNQYYEAKLEEKVDLCYIPTMEDGNKIKKVLVAIKAYIKFLYVVKKFDILHVHMSHRASFYRKSYFIKKAYSLGKKIVIHMHGSEFDVFYNDECDDVKKKEIRDVFSCADAVIALSEEWKEFLATICDRNKISVLYNAVIIPEYVRDDYSDKNVLFLGRLGKRKGTYDLIEAIPSVLKKVPNAKFYIGGDGDIEQVMEIVRNKGLEAHIQYIGWIKGEQKVDMLKKCSVFTLPSYHEGMPMAILEAMSYGEIVVSTTIGGIPKVISDGKNGYLIEPGNIEQLAEKIIVSLIGENKKAIGENAYRTIIDDFNMINNVEKLIELYSKC